MKRGNIENYKQDGAKTFPKAQWTQVLPAFTKRTAFKSCHDLVGILLQNLDQAAASKSSQNFWLKRLTNLLPQNLVLTPASES